MVYDLSVLILGLAFLAGAVIPQLSGGRAPSMPMLYVGTGIMLAFLWPDIPRVDPIASSVLVERLAELAVIISLTSAGLKLDRPLGWRSWLTTWRLLAITMPLCIAALAMGGVWVLGLPLAAALLLGAVIAPTDPVLAASVQVGPPGEDSEHEVRFALTSEAGLNDGLAFPFVNLAIVVAATGLAAEGLATWLAVDVVWKIAAGLAMGVLIGQVVAWIVFRLCKPDAVTDGYVALALTLLAYGATELVHGYGFIAVFVAALLFRRSEKDHDYHHALHDFSEQMEQLLMAAILLVFGVAIAQGLLSSIGWDSALLAVAFLFVIRPAAGWLGLVGTGLRSSYRLSIAGLGIRGVGTFYYLAHGLNAGAFSVAAAQAIWAIAGLIVVLSIVLHGLSAPRVMHRIDRGD